MLLLSSIMTQPLSGQSDPILSVKDIPINAHSLLESNRIVAKNTRKRLINRTPSSLLSRFACSLSIFSTSNLFPSNKKTKHVSTKKNVFRHAVAVFLYLGTHKRESTDLNAVFPLANDSTRETTRVFHSSKSLSSLSCSK